jgi:hypothetical protein
MKKILVCLLFVFNVSLLIAQESASINHLLKDPSVTSELYKPIDVMTVEKLQINPEMEFSRATQSIKIPVAYPFQNFVFGANLPIQRKTITAGDKSKSPIGIGDMSLSAAYTSYLADGFEGWDFDYAGNLTVKLPTGNKDKTVKISGLEYSAAMGSGSLDFIFSGNALMRKNDREILTDLKFRFNGENDNKVKQGNMFSLKGRYGFLQFEPKFDGYISLLVVIGSDGKYDNPLGSDTIEMSMFIIDITPELHYLTPFGMATVGISLPFITSTEFKTTRDVIVRFGVSKEY